MATLPQLPSPSPGEPIKASHIKQLADAIRRCWVTAAEGGGLNVAYGMNGISLASSAADAAPRVMVVTTLITAKSGSTAGVGAAKDATFNVSTRAMATGTGAAVPVYNYHTGANAFKVGATIGAFPRYGVLWAFDVDVCTNLQ